MPKPLVALDDLAQLEAVHLWHSGLTEHQVGGADLHLLDGVVAMHSRGDLKASLFQADLHDAQTLRVTIDQKQVLLRHRMPFQRGPTD